MACEINASPSNGLVQSADGSGVIKLKSNGLTTNALAWVNFNGTGTVAIRSSYNVSSITDNGTGDYTVNFATALSDANYAVMVSVQSSDAVGTNYSSGYIQSTAYSTSSIRVGCLNSTDGVNDRDTPSYNLVVFGN
jgi:hypothetical protein